MHLNLNQSTILRQSFIRTGSPSSLLAAAATASSSILTPNAPPSTSSKQLVDFTVLAACSSALRQSGVIPSKVEQCIQWHPTDIAMRIRNLSSTSWLNISWHPTAARVCLGSPPPRGATSEAFTFGEQLNANLSGLILVGCSIPQPWERVLSLQFGQRPGEKPTRTLICEVMARYSNLILTDEESGLILAVATQVGTAKSSLRLLQTGSRYELPPITQGIQPVLVSSVEEAEWRDNVTRASTHSGQGRIVDGLCRFFQGCSPQLVEQLCILSRSGIDASTPAASLNDSQWGALREQWNAWIHRIDTGSFECSSSPVWGKYSVIGSRVYENAHPDFFLMVETIYSELQGSEVHAQLHHRLSQAVAGAVKKAQGRKYAFEKQLKEADKVNDVQRQGDMIKANLYRIKAGMSEVTVESWETGEPIVIKLDPLVSPVSMAEGIYKKARKLRRAVDAVKPLLEAVESELSYLDDISASLEGLKAFRDDPSDYQALLEIKEELVEQQVLKPEPDAALAAKGAAKGKKGGGNKGAVSKNSLLGFRRYVSPSGYEVLIGRNNRQNDELSNRVAQPDDLWFHVRGCPGSHAIIRVNKGVSSKESSPSLTSSGGGQGKGEGSKRGTSGTAVQSSKLPPDVDVQFAADLCAFFSRGKENGKADVIVALAKDLKKPRGAKPGQIMVVKELRNVVARPNESAAKASTAE